MWETRDNLDRHLAPFPCLQGPLRTGRGVGCPCYATMGSKALLRMGPTRAVLTRAGPRGQASLGFGTTLNGPCLCIALQWDPVLLNGPCPCDPRIPKGWDSLPLDGLIGLAPHATYHAALPLDLDNSIINCLRISLLWLGGGSSLLSCAGKDKELAFEGLLAQQASRDPTHASAMHGRDARGDNSVQAEECGKDDELMVSRGQLAHCQLAASRQYYLLLSVDFPLGFLVTVFETLNLPLRAVWALP